MKIGTVRAEEARIFDSHAGYHQFHSEVERERYGSFEVFWWGEEDLLFGVTECSPPGWYWWACHPGCLPDGDPEGPFASSAQAHKDADPWAPEYDEED